MKPSFGQILHQRILRRQVEDVVLHDPGRHDQDRLRMHLVGGRIVLDQLDQFIAKHDLAARGRNGFADDEIVAVCGGLARATAAASSRCTSSASRRRNSRRRSGTPSAALPDWSRRNWTAPAYRASAGSRTRRRPRSAGATPRTPVLASCHHCSSEQKGLRQQVERRTSPTPVL